MRSFREQMIRIRYRRRLPMIACGTVIGKQPITIVEPVDKPGGLTLEELCVLVGVCNKEKPKNFFEFGSFRGRSTVNVLHNCTDVHVTTFDLPHDARSDEGLTFALVPADKKLLAEERGSLFDKYPQLSTRLTRLYGDSARYDFGPLHNRFDVVFIDASHRYENVVQDSENALRMLRGGKGVILWHDYEPHRPGVILALHRLASARKLSLVWIKRTMLAYLKLG